MLLTGTVALVTGASSAIGAATAAALAGQGAQVALVARRRDRLDAVAGGVRERGGSALVLEADITDSRQAGAAVDWTVIELGRLDTVVTNAEVMLLGRVLGAPLAEWERMVAVNVLGTLYVTHAAVPHLVRAAAEEPHGVADLVTIGASSATFGLAAFAESLRRELVPWSVRVSVVDPGTIDTEPPWPDQIAGAVLDVVTRDRRVAVNESRG
jgi:NADP-dependent 3-hydroxy acid dehydrogenase YdfG